MQKMYTNEERESMPDGFYLMEADGGFYDNLMEKKDINMKRTYGDRDYMMKYISRLYGPFLLPPEISDNLIVMD